METKIVVYIKNILCQRENFIIATAESDEIPLEFDTYMDGTLRIIGNINVKMKTKYVLYGEWKNHSDYGWQFRYNRVENYVPKSNDLKGIESYLCSGLFKGIGPKMASLIVKTFGYETLNIIENDINRLVEIKGISKKKVESIATSYYQAKKYENLMILLSPYGVSTNKIVRIIEKYGDNAEEILKENPYRLCKDIDGFGFLTADAFGLALNHNYKNIERIKEGIKYCLKLSSNTDGHVYLTEKMLGNRLSKLLNSHVVEMAKKEFYEIHKRNINNNSNEDIEEYKSLLSKYAVMDEDVCNALLSLTKDNEVVIEYFVSTRKNGSCYYEKDETLDILVPTNMKILEEEKIEIEVKIEENVLIENENENKSYNSKIEYEFLYKPFEREDTAIKKRKSKNVENKNGIFYKTKNGYYILKNDFGVLQQDCYLKRLWYAEKNSVNQLKRILSNSSFKSVNSNLSIVIANLEKKYKVTYAKNQKLALINSLKKNVLVVTGGPGTGKTTTIKGILGIYSYFFPQDYIQLAAPTGRAAKRMSEATNMEASTIHRLLEYGFNGFARNKENPLDCKLLILDEISMLDIELFSLLLNAIPDDCKLILVGDANQLPSVGPGMVLKDLIESNVIPCVSLNEIFRQKDTSLIIVNSFKINNKETDLEFGKDFSVLYEDIEKKEEDIVKDIISIYKKEIVTYGVSNVQMLVPFRKKHTISVDELNKVLAPIANPRKKYDIVVNSLNKEFCERDRVMQMSNNYDKGVFNGDIGTIISIVYVDEDIEMKVDFDGLVVSYNREDLEQLDLAYATTIHKSQGSEYKSIIMPVLKSQSFFLNRSIFYTGITRAKVKVNLVANPSAIPISIRQDDNQKRKTKLSTKLNYALS